MNACLKCITCGYKGSLQSCQACIISGGKKRFCMTVSIQEKRGKAEQRAPNFCRALLLLASSN